MSKQPAVIIDVNGCLGDCSNRSHFIEDPDNRDWDGFFKAMMIDTPVDQVHRFCNAQSEHPFFSKVILITGAPEKYRDLMEKWLVVNQVQYDRLCMRGNYQFIKGFEFKRKIYEDTLKYDYDVVLALDDKEECAEMYRSLGIACWLVAPCPYPRQEKEGRPTRQSSNPYRRSYRERRPPRPR